MFPDTKLRLFKTYCIVMVTLLVILGVLWNGCAHADEWGKGWCMGYGQAVEMSRINRDHYQKLIGLPTESSEDALLRIFSQADSTGKHLPFTSQTCIQTVMDGVDLYVTLPRLSENQIIYLVDGKQVTCPFGDTKNQ